MRILLLAPTSNSLYSRATAHLIQREPGLELAVVVIRSIFNWKRLRAELRRDGPRLLQKVRQKFVLGVSAPADDDREGMGAYIEAIGLPRGTLRDDARCWDVPCPVVPDHNHSRVVDLLLRLKPDLVVFTGGGLIRQKVLDLAGGGVLNCHSGILPRYRGMDVVEWPLLEQEIEPEIGLTTHFMDRGVDTGPILLQYRERVRRGDSFESIRRRMEPRMPELMLETLLGLRDGTLTPQPQREAEGQQYFVMHRRLRDVAGGKLRRLAG
jgi:methionyl-tRNA formyltransferase